MRDLVCKIAQTPAPTFQEDKRAGLIEELWRSFGLKTERDQIGNVLVRLGSGPKLCLAAHLDTVFSETELDFQNRFQDDGERIIGPGIGDNAASLAILTKYLAKIAQNPPGPLLIAATVGEEGLGDLRGAKYLLETCKNEISDFVALDGYLGQVADQAVGSKRLEIVFYGPGGHSWSDAGAPSAIEAVGRAIGGLYALPLPKQTNGQARTTLNVGLIEGGTSINSIAAKASLLVDLRSLREKNLAEVLHKISRLVENIAAELRLKADLKIVGQRPAGQTENSSLKALAKNALQSFGLPASFVASSTDANAAVAHGIPTICLGLYRGGNAHRFDEWIEIKSLQTGLELLTHFTQQWIDSGLRLA